MLQIYKKKHLLQKKSYLSDSKIFRKKNCNNKEPQNYAVKIIELKHYSHIQSIKSDFSMKEKYNNVNVLFRF